LRLLVTYLCVPPPPNRASRAASSSSMDSSPATCPKPFQPTRAAAYISPTPVLQVEKLASHSTIPSQSIQRSLLFFESLPKCTSHLSCLISSFCLRAEPFQPTNSSARASS